MKKQITVAVALIRDNQKRILLQKRVDPLVPDADQKWEFPGGKVEHREDPKETIQRECQEEVGCEIRLVGTLPSIQSNIWKRTDGVELHAIVICYVAQLVEGVPITSDKKVAEVRWFAEKEIDHLDTLTGISEFIALAKEIQP